MSGDAAMRVFTFHIDEAGHLTKDPPMPWSVGPPGSKITIRMVNRHAGTFHRVRLERWTHKDSRKPLDPLTGTKVWQIIGGPMFESPSEHKVRDHKKYGRYTFDARFDGVLFDPELIVDPPPPRPPKKPRAAGAAKAAGKAKKGKAGGAKKKKSGKASRSARRAKKGKPRKAGRSAGKRR